MRRMIPVVLTLVAAAACARSEQQPAADSPAAAMAAPASAMLSLGDVAGTWNAVGKREGSDSVLVSYAIKATADTTGWTVTFANGLVVPLHVWSVAGDSMVLHSGPYESVLRKGVQVTTHSVMRLQDGRLVGTVVAHYSGGGPDSVVNIGVTAMRAQ
jgi:hypothetical protein